MQEKQLVLVTYEQAKKLKELGFDWETDCIYRQWKDDKPFDVNKRFIKCDEKSIYIKDIAAPTVALALKWFRDVNEINNTIGMNDFCDSMIYYGCYVIQKGNIGIYINTGLKSDLESTYEESESALLDALLEHCEKEVQNA